MTGVSVNWGSHFGKPIFVERGPEDPYVTEQQFREVFGEPDLPYKARLVAWVEAPVVQATYFELKVAGFKLVMFDRVPPVRHGEIKVDDLELIYPHVTIKPLGQKLEPWAWGAVAKLYPKYAERHNPPEPRLVGRTPWSRRSVGTIGHTPGFWFVRGYLQTLRLISTIQKEAGYAPADTWKVKLENPPRTLYGCRAVGHWVIKERGSYLVF